MEIQVVITGSNGNCFMLKDKNTCILIDAGFQSKKIMTEKLEPILLENKIDAILITHEHSDHLSSWTCRLAMEYNIPIYLHAKHYEAEENRKNKIFTHLDKRTGDETEVIKCFIEEDKEFYIKELKIYPFTIYHDARKTLGYRFNDDELTLVTDCGFLSNKIKKELLESKNIALEFNYDVKELIKSDRIYENKFRTLGKFGHLNIEEAMDFINLAYNKYKKQFDNVICLHLSEAHNSQNIMKKLIKEKLNENIKTKFYISERYKNKTINLEREIEQND